MRIHLNGEARDTRDGLSIADLLAELGLTERRVAVELNLDIVPRSLHADTRLREGDRLEIVHAIGGG
ncbi:MULTISPECIES: sulfur carrier protein ThiS [Pseudomonas]|uniref:Sulfur carrier protein ThiS n=1 Tax=Pseudomonas flexibilis TaxID=706570 RepID=A0A0B2D854_9PSED|nr:MULTISPECIES: sulfur carrier protein ThiS [Pseudomonas]KHL69110.1 sulfur carrier protein ThiS [Pseudomonas flexibilis]KHO64909.1 thiamine biosynthesis protein ThiS [Pseudomonas flexibilis]SCX95069.1 sulfur carrier protein [Pseudomonas flexibilis]SIR02985.1 sulfur carrier protein ThiS [Pseudomonas flexibilis]